MEVKMNNSPVRGATRVASQFIGWLQTMAFRQHAFRYATHAAECRVPTARRPWLATEPAVETAGYHCQMPNGIPATR